MLFFYCFACLIAKGKLAHDATYAWCIQIPEIKRFFPHNKRIDYVPT